MIPLIFFRSSVFRSVGSSGIPRPVGRRTVLLIRAVGERVHYSMFVRRIRVTAEVLAGAGVSAFLMISRFSRALDTSP